MGFDQYHEPPDELPAATRTFARLCASLTEEAEAIGWYEQRLAVETDPEALAIMRDAQGEEFKHFSMDIEFLLRRTPRWREIAQGVLFQPGDIVEHGEEAEAQSRRRGRPSPERGRRRLAGDRQPEGSGEMNHLLRPHAPITDAGWKLLDEEARERLEPALAARKLVDFSGPLGWEHSATNLGRVTRSPLAAGEGRHRPAAAGAAARRAARRLRVSLTELRDHDRGAPTSTSSTLDEAAHEIALAENIAVFHGWREPAITGIAEASPHKRPALGADAGRLPAARREPPSSCCSDRDRRPVRRSRSAASSTRAW